MPKINKNTNIAPPQELIEALRAINEQREPKIAKLEANAEAWLDAFSEKIDYCHEMLYSKGIKIASLIGNLREQTIKLALLATSVVLVPRGASAPSIEYEEQTVITLKAIKWAASVALHSFKNSIKLAQSLSESPNEEYLNKIMSRLGEGKGKGVTRRDLCKSIGYKLMSYQLDALMAPLVESDEILLTRSSNGKGILYSLNPKHPNYFKRKNK